MINIHKNKNGYSLLELITIIAMLSILTAVALTFIGSNKSQVELESAANEVVAALREAQNYSLTGKKAGADDCDSYKFETSDGTRNYSITGFYTDNSGTSVQCGFNMNYTLTGDVLFNGINSVTFTAPHGDVNAVTISLNKEGKSYYVCVNSAGLITKVNNLPCP